MIQKFNAGNFVRLGFFENLINQFDFLDVTSFMEGKNGFGVLEKKEGKDKNNNNFSNGNLRHLRKKPAPDDKKERNQKKKIVGHLVKRITDQIQK